MLQYQYSAKWQGRWLAEKEGNEEGNKREREEREGGRVCQINKQQRA